MPSPQRLTSPLLQKCWGRNRTRPFQKRPSQLHGGSGHLVEEGREGQRPGGAERKSEAMASEERCQEKVGRGEVVAGYGFIRRLGEEVLPEQPIPVASSGQTHARPSATVILANKVLGSVRNELKTDIEDAVTATTETS